MTAAWEPGLLRFRVTQHVEETSSFEVGGLKGRVVGAGRSGGLAMFEDGRFATLDIAWTIDFVDGSGVHLFYTRFTFEDGSAFVTRGEGWTEASADGRRAGFRGEAVIVAATGSFAGAAGRGTYRGWRFAPLGTSAEVLLDYELTLEGDGSPAAATAADGPGPSSAPAA